MTFNGCVLFLWSLNSFIFLLSFIFSWVAKIQLNHWSRRVVSTVLITLSPRNWFGPFLHGKDFFLTSVSYNFILPLFFNFTGHCHVPNLTRPEKSFLFAIKIHLLSIVYALHLLSPTF